MLLHATLYFLLLMGSGYLMVCLLLATLSFFLPIMAPNAGS